MAANIQEPDKKVVVYAGIAVFYITRRKTAILRHVGSLSIVLLFMGVWQDDFHYDVIYLKSSGSFSIKSSARYFASIFSIP